ncbi:MAG: TonB family protein [Acidimicrobiia bacterium]|nr:TonB family protein [Acidimicrobiia bacterium]
MPETSATGGTPYNSSAGHLSVHVEGQHPDEVPFLFEQQGKRIGPSLVVAFLCHLAFLGFILWAVTHGPPSTFVEARIPDRTNTSLVFLDIPGRGGGGGGGGNKMPEPPRKPELPGKEKITVPVAKPPVVEQLRQQVEVEPPPIEPMNIHAKNMANGLESLAGVIDAPPAPPTPSQGAGSGGGGGTGAGIGIGSGTGSGLGEGRGGGTGGGVYQLGSGVTKPILVYQAQPKYTAEAMRARIQGSVFLSCVVRSDGTVTDIQVIRSLDRAFGLDDEAIKTLSAWRFRPSTLRGEPVAVRVEVEITFSIR